MSGNLIAMFATHFPANLRFNGVKMRASIARYSTALPILVLAILSLTRAPAAQAQSADEYEVYAAVLDSMFSAVFAGTFAVSDSTLGPVGPGTRDLAAETLSNMAQVSADAKSDYTTKNAAKYLLNASGFPSSVPVVIVTDAASVQDLVYFTRVGFDPTLTEAVVHLVYSCGSRCLFGDVVHLQKVNGTWTIQLARPTIGKS